MQYERSVWILQHDLSFSFFLYDDDGVRQGFFSFLVFLEPACVSFLRTQPNVSLEVFFSILISDEREASEKTNWLYLPSNVT